MSIALPATAARIAALAALLGLELPEEYRSLLAEANGVSANLVQIYPADVVPERNATYQVDEYAPGYFVVGTVNDFPVLLRAGPTSPVYENDWGAMTPDCMDELAPSLTAWIERGCPGRTGRTAADQPEDESGTGSIDRPVYRTGSGLAESGMRYALARLRIE